MTLPAVDSLATYGGALVDLPGEEVTDPTTDRPAAGANKAFGSVAAATHTALRCWTRFITAATTGAMIRTAHDAVWGNATGVAPAIARTTTGVFTITWPTTVVDELGVTQSVLLRALLAPVASGATAYHVQAELTSANVVTIRVFDMAGVATDAAGTTVFLGAI